MIKVTLGQILNSVTPATNQAESAWQRLFQQPLSAIESFRLRRLAPQLDERVKTFYETRGELVKRYGTPIKGAEGKYKIEDENIDAFNQEIQQLLDVEETLDGEPLKLSRLIDIRISAADLGLFEDWLIVE